MSERPALRELHGHVSRREPATILAIGSSSTEGVGASSPALSYPAQLESRLRKRWGGLVVVRNAGIGGETIEQTVARLEQRLAQRPDLVLWQVGTNDAIRGGDEATFRAKLEQGIAAVRRAGSDIILVDQQFYPGIVNRARYERFVRIVREVGTANRVSVFSRYAAMKEWHDRRPSEFKQALAPDAFHLSDRGYACLAAGLEESLAGEVGVPQAAAPAATQSASLNVQPR